MKPYVHLEIHQVNNGYVVNDVGSGERFVFYTGCELERAIPYLLGNSPVLQKPKFDAAAELEKIMSK